jgi:hypothetical protein
MGWKEGFPNIPSRVLSASHQEVETKKFGRTAPYTLCPKPPVADACQTPLPLFETLVLSGWTPREPTGT